VRRALAERVGATRAIHPDELVVPPLPFTIVDDPYDVAFECSGKAVAVESALAQLGKTGTLCLMGTGAERPQFDAMRVLLNELVVTGAYAYDEGGFDRALELIGNGSLPTDLLVAENDVGLDDLMQAMQQLVAGEIGGKVLVVPN
jgi:threonine dehydrogenase-like Zn-dependent dehydrogenase